MSALFGAAGSTMCSGSRQREVRVFSSLRVERPILVLTASTNVAFSQVFSRCLTYFDVTESSVSAVQGDFQSGFDSRQLHHRSRPGRKAWPVFVSSQRALSADRFRSR